MGWIALFSFLFGFAIFAVLAQRKGWSENTAAGGSMALGLVTMVTALVLANPSEPAKPLTPAEQREARIVAQFSAWDGAHRNLEAAVKRAMNDPDSYEHIDTTYTDRGDHVFLRTNFRGNNAFGGKVVNQVVAKADLDGNIIELEQRTP